MQIRIFNAQKRSSRIQVELISSSRTSQRTIYVFSTFSTFSYNVLVALNSLEIHKHPQGNRG